MEAEKQNKKQFDWLKPYQFQKGQSGNPGGRPTGKSLKTFAREYLEMLPDEDKIEFMATLPAEIVWKMAEGNPKQDTEVHGSLTISDVLDNLENGSETKEQGVEAQQPLQDPQ